MIIIYLITNTVNAKKYVGQTTKKLNERWRRHCWRSEYVKNMPIGSAIIKYGKDKFNIIQIDEAETLEEANRKEVKWAEFYECFSPNGYNLKAGGRKYLYMSQETRDKISKAHKGRKASKETIDKLRKSHLGYVVKESTKIKLSRTNKGKPQHPNTTAAIRNKSCNKYILKSPEGIEIEVVNMREFCKENNLYPSNICAVTTGKKNSYKGWSLIENRGPMWKELGSRRNPLTSDKNSLK